MKTLSRFLILLSFVSWNAGAQVTPVKVGSSSNNEDGDNLKTAFEKINRSLNNLENQTGGGPTNGIPKLNGSGTNTDLTAPTLRTPTLTTPALSPTAQGNLSIYHTNKTVFADQNPLSPSVVEDGSILRPFTSFENAITNGADVVKINSGSYTGIGQAGVAAMKISNDIKIDANGATLHRFSFAPQTNSLTMHGGTIDYLTDQVLGPIINLSSGPSNCFVRLYDQTWLIYSDGIKNGTAHSGFRFEASSCTFYVGFQAFNNCTADSTNAWFTLNDCTLTCTNSAGPVFDPGSSDAGTWFINNCHITGPGTVFRVDGSETVYINFGTIESTNGSWAIDAQGTTKVHIRGRPCSRNSVTNGPTAQIFWDDDLREGPTNGATSIVTATNLMFNGSNVFRWNYDTVKTRTWSGSPTASINNKVYTNTPATGAYTNVGSARSVEFQTDRWKILSGGVSLYTNLLGADGPLGLYGQDGGAAGTILVYSEAGQGKVYLFNDTTVPLAEGLGAGNMQITVSNGIPHLYSTVDGTHLIDPQFIYSGLTNPAPADTSVKAWMTVTNPVNGNAYAIPLSLYP